jgi:5-methylthioadenosine/S-adenosylhomocysteine deaminase
MELLIKNATILTADDERPVIQKGYIGIDGGKIVYLSDVPPLTKVYREKDATDCIIMPGMINAHTHVSMSSMRGWADDYALQDWLFNYIFPVEGRHTPDTIYVSAMLGIAEMIRCGTISITDMYMQIPFVAQAAQEAGIYANISNGATCFDAANYDFATDGVTRQMEEMLEKYHGADDGRIRLDASIHAEYTSFPKLWQANAEFAKKHGLNMHVHLSETAKEHEECKARYGGKTPAQVLAENGVFDTRTTAAHCVYVTEEDMALLASKQVSVAHNPVSNLKLASGIAPVAKMLEMGVNVALGTDGVASNNNHDLFEEMKLAAILQKGVSGDPTLLPAHQALKLATRGGAFAQGREKEIGMLKVGYDASLIMLNADRAHLQPVHDPLSTVVYSARGLDVCMTMVRGKVLYEDGVYRTIDLARIRHALKDRVIPQLFQA